MKNASLWIIRLALTVQFVGVLVVPSLLAQAEAPRGTWMAEWLRPNVAGRFIGVLTLRDGKLSFAEQGGEVGWEVEMAKVKRVTAVNGGRAIQITSIGGDEYITSVMDPSMTRVSPKKVLGMIEKALQLQAASSR